MLAGSCRTQRSSDYARQYAQVLPFDVTRAGWQVAFRCLGGGDRRRSIDPPMEDRIIEAYRQEVGDDSDTRALGPDAQEPDALESGNALEDAFPG